MKIDNFFPTYFDIIDTCIDEKMAVISLKSNRSEVSCPNCNISSTKSSTIYTRTIKDKPLGDHFTLLKVSLRKYICENELCMLKVFAEEINDFAFPRARMTNRLEKLVKNYGLTHSANSTSRDLIDFNILLSSSTVLRHSKNFTQEFDPLKVTAVAIDDFCLKKKTDMLR